MVSRSRVDSDHSLSHDLSMLRKHHEFTKSNLVSAPLPTHYYSQHIDSTHQLKSDKPQNQHHQWNANERSNISDLKQLDENNTSPHIYELDYEAQSETEQAVYDNDSEIIYNTEANACDSETKDHHINYNEEEGAYDYSGEYENDEEYGDRSNENDAAYWNYLNDYVASGDFDGKIIEHDLDLPLFSNEAQNMLDEQPASLEQAIESNEATYSYDEQHSPEYDDSLERSELLPFTLEQIEERVEVHVVPGKGRCTFARRDYRPGDIIFVETPLLVATPELDPELWDILKSLHDTQNFELPPTWHLAAIYSLANLNESDRAILFEKWVPEPNKEPSDDVWRVLEATKLELDPHLYEQALQVWRYNSFGHHSNTHGLALYNRISMLAHDCSASATWHYGVDDAFTLRARQVIPKGGEITLSYIGDEDLLKATHIRQDKLVGWLFTCHCQKCQSPRDTARGFKCPTCGGGSVFFKTVREAYEAVTADTTSALQCTICHATPTAEDVGMYLELEEAYINRLKATPKDDIMDVEHVYSEAQRVFSQHWILYQLDSILVEGYRERRCWDEAIYHQSNRIRYVSHVLPTLSYTLAWLYEEMGDIYAGKLDITIGAPLNPEKTYITGFQKNFMVDKYETAMYKLLLISGPENAFTIAAHEKLEYIMELGKGCFNEKASA